MITYLVMFHELTHRSRVTHVCVSKPCHFWYRWWFFTCTVPSHYLNHCWPIAYGTKLKWIVNRAITMYIKKNEYANFVKKKWGSLPRPQCVKAYINEIYITYPFPNFNGCTVEVWEWISNVQWFDNKLFGTTLSCYTVYSTSTGVR